MNVDSNSVGFNSNGRAMIIEDEDLPIDHNVSQLPFSKIISKEPLEDESNYLEKEKNNSSKDNSYLNQIFKYGLDFDLFKRVFKENFWDFSNQTYSTNVTMRNYSMITNLEPGYGFEHKIQEQVTDKDNISKSFQQRVTLTEPNRVYSGDSVDANINATRLNEDTRVDNITDVSVTKANSEVTDLVMNSGIAAKTYDLKNNSQKYCISSNDCDIDLNERCIKRKKHSVCDCKEPFFRETSSNKCQIKKLIRLLFKISQNESKVLNNSIESIQLKHSIEATIWSAITESSYPISIVDDIKAIELKNWQIVVDFYVNIADPSNDFHNKYIEYNFWYRLMSTIRGIDFKSQTILNSFNMKAVEVVDEINYCSVEKLNYCSDYADCFEDSDSEVKFFCKCKPGLTDMSVSIQYSGEVCALKCSTDLCGSGGVCEVKNQTEIHCICKNWNFGERCQYSLNALLAVISLIGLLSIFFSFCLTALYCGFKIHEEFVELRKMIKNNSDRSNTVRII